MGGSGSAAAAGGGDGTAIPSDNSVRPSDAAVAAQGADVRASFIDKTYIHLAGAILLFTGFEFFFKVSVGQNLAVQLTNFAHAGRFNWLSFLGLFAASGWVADRWAVSATSRKTQYLGLMSALVMGVIIAGGGIIAASTYGFTLGIALSVGMVVLASGFTLFYTSRVLAHYHQQQHVAAALSLFSAIALMFWYVIRILMEMRK